MFSVTGTIAILLACWVYLDTNAFQRELFLVVLGACVLASPLLLLAKIPTFPTLLIVFAVWSFLLGCKYSQYSSYGPTYVLPTALLLLASIVAAMAGSIGLISQHRR